MTLKLTRRTLKIVIFLAIALLWGQANEAIAQTNAAYYLQLSAKNAEWSNYYYNLCLDTAQNGYSDTNGYCPSAKITLNNARVLAEQATAYALIDYTSSVNTLYYQAYNEYITLNSIKSYLASAQSNLSAGDSATDVATKNSYYSNGAANLYNANLLYGSALYYAGCEPYSNPGSNLRSGLMLSDQNLISAQHYVMLGLYSKLLGYSGTGSAYMTYAFQYLSYAYAYAQNATIYAQTDSNNNISSSYYRSYYEYTTMLSIQNYLATAISYFTLSSTQTTAAASYNYDCLGFDNIYNARHLFVQAANYAGCVYSLY